MKTDGTSAMPDHGPPKSRALADLPGRADQSPRADQSALAANSGAGGRRAVRGKTQVTGQDVAERARKGSRWQAARYEFEPETLAGLAEKGLPVWVWCEDCCHNKDVPVSSLLAHLPATTPVPEVRHYMRCSRCQSRNVATRPSWPKSGQCANVPERQR